MRRIICELSNVSNKLKDTKANQNTIIQEAKILPQNTIIQEAKILPRPYGLPYISRFHLCLSCLIWKLLFIWSTGRNFERLSLPLLILSVSRFLGGGEIDLGLNYHGSKKSACILYGLYTFKMPMGIL